MSKEWYNDPKFLELRDEWYKKLEKDGFRDVEILDEITRQPGSLMHGPSPGDLRRGLYKVETEEYYRLCRQHVWRIPERKRQHVWRMHAEGASVQKIFDTLGARYSLKRGTIARIIKDEEAAMHKALQKELSGEDDR